jgi:TrmH family RNA methyltransferase
MRYKEITSPQNPFIKALLKIKTAPAYGSFLIEGPNLIKAALHRGAAQGNKTFATREFLKNPRGASLIKKLERAGAEIYLVSDGVLKKLAGTETPQGILAVAALPAAALADIKPPSPALIAVADGIKEPGNMGALIRNADAARAGAVITLPGTTSPLSPKALRASAGSIFNLPVVHARLDELASWLKKNGITLVGMDTNAETTLYEADLTTPAAFVFGEEAHGLGQDIKEKAGMLLKIPMFGKAESLNVAAASAVTLFEARRQRQK